MNQKIEFKRDITVEEETDILVVGGSQSGSAAAICAKRANPNAKVILIEQNGYLGGQSVGTMVIHYEFREYINNAGQRIVKGIGEEIINRIVSKGHSDPLYSDFLKGRGPPFKQYADPRAVGDIPLDLEDIKLTLQEMCEEVGVIIRLSTKLVDIISAKSQDGKIKPEYAVIADLGGLKAIKPKIIIDCSANNDVSWFMGGTEKNNYVTIAPQKVMAMQTYAWFANVDLEKFVNAVWDDIASWPLIYPNNKEQMMQFVREGRVIMMRGGADYINAADEKWPGICEQYEKLGTTPLIYYWLKTIKTNNVIFGDKTKYIGEFAIEGPSYRTDQTNPAEVNKALLNQLHATHILLKIHSILPGWENTYVSRTSDHMGCRQTRILNGVYKLTRKDVKEHRKFEDVIGRNTGHDVGRGNALEESGYDIPYRVLISQEIDNLLVGARSVSCDTSDDSLTSLNAHRGICSTMVVGQACGVAAALCIKNKTIPRNLDVKELQKVLKKQEVVLNSPELK
jgi:hypothetical protein